MSCEVGGIVREIELNKTLNGQIITKVVYLARVVSCTNPNMKGKESRDE